MLEEIKDLLKELSHQVEELEGDDYFAPAKIIADLKEELSEAKSSHESEISKLKASLVHLKKDNSELEFVIKDLRNQVKDFKKAYEVRYLKVEELQSTVRGLRSENEKLREEIRQIKSDNYELQEGESSLYTENQNLKSKVEAQEVVIKNLQDLVMTYSNRLHHINQGLLKLVSDEMK